MKMMIGVLLSFVVAVPLNAQQSARTDITGVWTFNAKDSDKASEFMPRMGPDSGGRMGQRPEGPPPDEPGGSGRRGGGFGPPGGGGFGPPGGGGGRRGRMPSGGGPMNEEGRARMRQTMQLAFAAPHALRISLADSTLWVVRDKMADSIQIRMDGKKHKLEPSGGGEVEVRARLHEGLLTAEWKVDGGGKIKESYFPTTGRRQLVVLLELEMGGGRESVQFRRIYDRAAPSDSTSRTSRYKRRRIVPTGINVAAYQAVMNDGR